MKVTATSVTRVSSLSLWITRHHLAAPRACVYKVNVDTRRHHRLITYVRHLITVGRGQNEDTATIPTRCLRRKRSVLRGHPASPYNPPTLIHIQPPLCSPPCEFTRILAIADRLTKMDEGRPVFLCYLPTFFYDRFRIIVTVSRCNCFVAGRTLPYERGGAR